MRDGWKEVTLKHVAPYFTKKIDAKELNAANYISADNMLVDKGGVTDSVYVPTSGKSTLYNQNDILVSNIRPYFKKIWYAKSDGGCSNDVIVFRTIDNIADSKFIFYYLSKDDFFDYMMAGSNGTKMPRGNKKSIPDYSILLPPLPTQRKIASILSGYDNLIENNLRRIKLLEEKAQLTYEEWFVKMRFPGYETAVFDKLTALPEGWQNKNLNEVIDVIIDNRGKNPKYYSEHGIPVIDNYLITNKTYVDYSKCKRFIDEQVYNNFIRKYLKPADILITLVGNGCGSISVAPKAKSVIIQNTVGLRCNNLCNQYFLYWYLIYNRKNIQNQNRGSAQPSIKVGDLLELKILLPNSDLMNLFAIKISPIFTCIENLSSQNHLLKEARDILLPRLMSGMVDVEELEIGTLEIAD